MRSIEKVRHGPIPVTTSHAADVPDPADALALLTAGIDALAATDPGGLATAVVAEQLTTLDHLANRLDAQFVRLLGVFDARGGTAAAATPATPYRRGRHRRE